jgi:hypothetical protein
MCRLPCAGDLLQFLLLGTAVKKGAMKVDTAVVGSRYGIEISEVGPCVVGLQVQKKLHPFTSFFPFIR